SMSPARLLSSLCLSFYLYCGRDHRNLHSFPTRRSSDLGGLKPLTGGSYGVVSSGLFFMTNPVDPMGNAILYGGVGNGAVVASSRSEEHTSELQSRFDLVCRLLLEKKKKPLADPRRFARRWTPWSLRRRSRPGRRQVLLRRGFPCAVSWSSISYVALYPAALDSVRR